MRWGVGCPQDIHNVQSFWNIRGFRDIHNVQSFWNIRGFQELRGMGGRMSSPWSWTLTAELDYNFYKKMKTIIRVWFSVPIKFIWDRHICSEGSYSVKFISTFINAPTTYLKSWALVISIIDARFMVDQHLFLFETLAWIDNTFPFQQHFKATCDLLPPLARVCLLPFEQLIEQQMVQLQNSFSKRLHHHTLFNMFSNEIFKAHRARILSSFGLGANAWFMTQPIFLAFQLSSLVFSTTLRTQLGLSHPSIVCIPHIPSTLWVSTSYVVHMATNTMEPIM